MVANWIFSFWEIQKKICDELRGLRGVLLLKKIKKNFFFIYLGVSPLDIPQVSNLEYYIRFWGIKKKNCDELRGPRGVLLLKKIKKKIFFPLPMYISIEYPPS
jgi:hypothetical protein